MALTDAQRRAQEAYRKKSVKQVTARFYPAERDGGRIIAKGRFLPRFSAAVSGRFFLLDAEGSRRWRSGGAPW